MNLIERKAALFQKKSQLCRIAFLVMAFMVLFGCASSLTTVMPRPPEKYEKLGRASGSGCGSLLIGGTAYYFIPVMLNSRVERAYSNALESVPGATALTDVTMQEDWYWWILGTTRCVTITGEAIR